MNKQLTDDQVKRAKSKTLTFPFGQNGRNHQNDKISIYDFAASSYEDLLDNDIIPNKSIPSSINSVYKSLKDDIGINHPENYFKLFHQAFQYTAICFNKFDNTDIVINRRAYDCLENTQLYHFDPDLSHLKNLLDYQLLTQMPYDQLLDIKGIGKATADHIVDRLFQWSKDNHVTDYKNRPLFKHL